MEITELLDQLQEHSGSFPEKLIAECIARREEMIPRLLEILEDVERDPDEWADDLDCTTHIYAMYLLALFREQRAYPPMLRLFNRPGDFAFRLIGDSVTQDLGSMLASVCGGDTAGITALIENEEANEWVRGAAIDAMAKLVPSGQRPREEVMAYFLSLFQKLERTPSSVWDSLANACSDLWPQEALQELERAYDEELIDSQSIHWEDIKRALDLGKEGAMNAAFYRGPLITDLAKDMGWMKHFHYAKE